MMLRATKAGAAKPRHDLPGGYSDVEVIGSGAGGVYRARQERFDRTVAVQILPAAGAGEPTHREFDDACRAMGDLSKHPNLVSVYDAGVTPAGSPFVAMEYCAGGSLRDHLAASGPLTVPEATAIGAKLASALNAVHRRGLVHGAVEPGNVLLTDFGEPVLAGTGLACVTRATTPDDLRDASGLAHAAPELLEGGEPSAASDVYSLGATLYTLLAGRPAHAAEAAAGLAPLVQRVLRDDVPPVPRPDVPEELLAVLRTAMAADPARRFGSAQEMRHALRGAAAVASGDGAVAAEAVTAVAAVAGSSAAPTAPASPAHAGEAEHPAAAHRPARWTHARRSALIVAAATFAGLLMAVGAGLGARSVVPPARPQPPPSPQPAPAAPKATAAQRAPELSKLDLSRYQPRNLRARPAARHVMLAWSLPADAARDGAAVIVRQEPATGVGVAALPRVGGALPRTYEAAGLQAGREYCFLVEVLLQRAGGSPALARSGPVCAVPR